MSALPDPSFALFRPLGIADLAALAFLAAAWWGVGIAIERSGAKRPSVSVLMVSYRREWMHHAITREPRVFDAMLISNLRQGTAFFASTSMIALGGGLALIGNVDRLSAIASDLPVAAMPSAIYEVKLIVVMVFLAHAFLKFVWANRVFGYCAVMIGAVPNDAGDPRAGLRADQAADLNIAAARAFNRGLRSTYFALAALAWLLGPTALAVATAITVVMLWRREFASGTRTTLMRSGAGGHP